MAQSALEKLQRDDHDTLIRLEGKVDNISMEMKQMTVAMTERYADHEARLRVVEKVVEQSKPEENLKLLNQTATWVSDFKVKWKLLIGVTGLLSGLAGAFVKVGLDHLINK